MGNSLIRSHACLQDTTDSVTYFPRVKYKSDNLPKYSFNSTSQPSSTSNHAEDFSQTMVSRID